MHCEGKLEFQETRRDWLRLLASADPCELQALWDSSAYKEQCRRLRAPETGLTMVRARADGAGSPFNFGEATVTRCVVSMSDSGGEDEIMGIGYVLGRDHRHAELTACFDALFQDSQNGEAARTAVLPGLLKTQSDRQSETSAKAAATRVSFFTMVRGE